MIKIMINKPFSQLLEYEVLEMEWYGQKEIAQI